MLEHLDQLQSTGLSELAAVSSPDALESWRLAYLAGSVQTDIKSVLSFASLSQVGLIVAVQSLPNAGLTVFELQVLMAAAAMTGGRVLEKR